MTTCFGRTAARLMLAIAAIACFASAYAASDKLGNRGLLVAYVHSDEYPDAKLGSPVVGTKTYDGVQKGGFIVLPLKPGEHDLTAIYRYKSTLTVATAVGNMYLHDFDAFKLGRPFRIEAGKVTNLGMIVVRGPQPVNGVPNALYLENARDMQDIVASVYPDVFASLDTPSFEAQGALENSRTVQSLRQSAAARQFSTPKWRSDHPHAGYVTAPYGAIARIRRDGSSATLDAIATETLMDLSDCSISTSAVACVLSPSNLLIVEDNHARVLPAPAGVLANSVHIANERELVLIDSAMNIHVSGDRGASWSKAFPGPFAKAVESGGEEPDNRNAFGMERGRDRDYFYSRAREAKSSALLARLPDGRFERVEIPPEMRPIQVLKETDSGLIAAAIGHGELWNQPRGQSAWQKLKLPQVNCSELAFGDSAGSHLELACTDNKFWISKDGGRHWSRIFKPQSLFAGQ